MPGQGERVEINHRDGVAILIRDERIAVEPEAPPLAAPRKNRRGSEQENSSGQQRAIVAVGEPRTKQAAAGGYDILAPSR